MSCPTAEPLLVRAELYGFDCLGVTDAYVVARRAGSVSRSRASLASFELSGTVALTTPGRWFVYVELTHTADVYESWIAVEHQGVQVSRGC